MCVTEYLNIYIKILVSFYKYFVTNIVFLKYVWKFRLFYTHIIFYNNIK